MNEHLQNVYLAVLAGLKAVGPTPFQPRLEFEAASAIPGVSTALFLQHLQSVGPNDPVRREYSLQFARWDDTDEPWAIGYPKRTEERRTAIYRMLNLSEEYHVELSELFPIHFDSTVVISEDFEPWYTSQYAGAPFYWPAYEQYLVNKPGWDAESVADLDSTTSNIVQRLSDPARSEAYQSKGLVVGYVQSGKTANITGVLAKAIDAGYRLLIVMTGTIDLLREQTQRRIDMELVGVENILRDADPNDPEMLADIDYQDDPDWPSFIRHGILPSNQNLPDIIRLTQHRFANRTGDYRRLLTGITALEFEKHDNTRPLNDRVNLDRCSARLAIVKKNKTVLTRLVRDLKSIRPRLQEIPALIIDDESDHASVNTSNPSKWLQDQRHRTAINSMISELLQLLPRSQYLGYTATPFANVFIDPNDAEDIFPRDYLIALSRPHGYMGARDFHDLEPEADDNGQFVRNRAERAHVRDLVATPDDDQERASEMREALAMFLLTGALKIFREQGEGSIFRHHTMLAHESVRRIDHVNLANELREVWLSAGFSSPEGLACIRNLYESDVVPTTRMLGSGSLPEAFESLVPFVAEAYSRITDSGDPVIIVNSDQDVQREHIDFDRRPVWRVLVGGAKLSRGFTVEGLTVSYYRRRTSQADTLMQMGRWFGFRKGYQDLVRLYIARQLRTGNRTLDLYEAFGAIMYAEELFREELRRYAQLVEGKPQIRPAQVPPLVTQHLPWLRPTAANKMFNARLVERRQQEIEPVGYPKVAAEIIHNYDTLLPIMQQASEKAALAFPRSNGVGHYTAKYGSISHQHLIASLGQLKWCYEDHFEPDLAFIEDIQDLVDEWIVLMPQLKRDGMRNLPGLGVTSVFFRTRRRDPLFQAISDPKHRYAARRIAGAIIDRSYEDAIADSLHRPRRGALIVYPMVEKDLQHIPTDADVERESCIIAVRVVPPHFVHRPDAPYVRFRVHSEDEADRVVVSRDEGSSE